MLGSVPKSSAIQISSERIGPVLPYPILTLLLLYSCKHTPFKIIYFHKKKPKPKTKQTKQNQNSLPVGTPFGQQKAK